jgi:hypothetical protein
MYLIEEAMPWMVIIFLTTLLASREQKQITESPIV